MRLIRYPVTWVDPPRGAVLVLAPHADDESLGCGGTILRHREQGDAVTIAIATDGAAGDPEGRFANLDYRELRRNEARAAAECLGVERLEFWELPDQGLRSATDLVERVRDCVERVRPSTVYLPPSTEAHPDHQALGAAWRHAIEGKADVPASYSYETWTPVRATHIFDVTSVWERKVRAARQYASQLAYNDYLRAAEGLATYRAIYLPSARYVEAFEEIRPGRPSA